MIRKGRTYVSKGYLLFLFAFLLLFCFQGISAQEDPPRPLEVLPVQSLAFGAMWQPGVTGTVEMLPDGTRNPTGSVILISLLGYNPAIFELRCNPGTLITIMNGPDILLTDGSGHSMNLEIGESDPVAPFVLTVPYPNPTQLKVGGILTVGSPVANPAGSYAGSFEITFNYQ